MTEFVNRVGPGFLAEPWIIRIIIILAVTAATNLLAEFVLRHVRRVTVRTVTVWDDALVSCASRPMLIVIWLVGLSLAVDILKRHVDEPFLEYVVSLRNIGIVVCIGWFLLRFIGRVSENIVAARQVRGDEIDRTTVDALSKLGRLVVVVSVLLLCLQTLGVSIAGVLTLGGIGGIAVGFAAKDLLANFFGGLTIYLDRPFSVGEWIRSPDKAIEGTVEYISWRHTRVRAFNKNPIYVPNALFTTIVVENPSRMTNRRIREVVGVRYDDLPKVAAIANDIRAMLQTHPDIDATQTLIVNFTAFAASSLDILVYTFTRTTVWVEYHMVKQDVLLKIADIIAAHGAQIAFPTQTLHVDVEPPPPDAVPA
jgi:MscS family membrane protein